MLSFYKQQTVFIQIVSKKSRSNNFILIENPKSNNIILAISIQYFAYPKERTCDEKNRGDNFLEEKKNALHFKFKQNIACSNLKTASILSVEECARNCESWI